LAENLRSKLQLEWQGQLSDLVTGLAWSPNGRSWVASSADGEILWIELKTAAPVHIAPDPRELVRLQTATGQSIDNLAFSADARWLAAGGQAGELLLWDGDPDNPQPQLVQTLNLGTWIGKLGWHPTLSLLAIGYGSQVKIWDATTATEITTWRFDRSSIFDLAWHPSGAYLAIAGYQGVEIWATADRITPSHKLPVDTASLQIAWSPDGRYLAAGNLDRSLTVMDWHHPNDPWILQGCPGKIRQLVWLNHLATPCLVVASGNEIVLWHLEANDWIGQLLAGHQGIVESIAADPDLPMFGSVATDGYACIWSAGGEIEQIITNELSGFTKLAWHPHAAYLAIGSRTGAIELWSSSA
jgi:WD40 repeat protein